MRILNCMIVWNDIDDETKGELAGKLKVGPWPDKTGWTKKYFYSTGACCRDWHKKNKDQLLALLFIELHAIIVRHRLDPQDVHKEFLNIDEYRTAIAPDIEGAMVLLTGTERKPTIDDMMGF